MNKRTLLTLLGTVLALSCAFTNVSSQVAPAPGAITASMSVASLNNIANVFTPILSYYMLNNHTVELNFKEKGLFYSLDIKSLHIDTVDGFAEKEVVFLDNTNTVRVLFSGVNISMDVDGSVYALWFIPFETSHCDITNLTIQMDFGVSTDDQVHW